MKSLAQQLLELQQQIDTARQENQKDQGALEVLLGQIRRKFGCKDLATAQRLLTKLQKEEARLRREFEQALREFQTKWKEYLNESVPSPSASK